MLSGKKNKRTAAGDYNSEFYNKCLKVFAVHLKIQSCPQKTA